MPARSDPRSSRPFSLCAKETYCQAKPDLADETLSRVPSNALDRALPGLGLAGDLARTISPLASSSGSDLLGTSKDVFPQGGPPHQERPTNLTGSPASRMPMARRSVWTSAMVRQSSRRGCCENHSVKAFTLLSG